MSDTAKTNSADNKASHTDASKLRQTPVIPLRLEQAAAALSRHRQSERRPKEIRRLILAASFILCVLIPTVLGAGYFLFFASERYAASAGFSVRSTDNTAVGADFLGSITGLSSVGTTTTDSYILLEYLKSRALLEKLREDIDFQAAYGGDHVDFFYRLDENTPIESLVDYWDWLITTSYDNTSSIISFEVQAFSPEDAQKVASLIVRYSQDLINTLSQQARKDAVQFAEKEVASAELRLKIIRESMRVFRSASNSVDPTATAAAQIELITGIEQQLIDLRARMTSLTSALDEGAPPVRRLRQQISSLEDQLRRKQAEISGTKEAATGKTVNLSALIADYEKLKVEQEFAQQAYATTLASLERARAEADRQQRFLAVFRSPGLPQEALYPERMLNSFLIFIVALMAWGIGTLIVYSVRDHLR